LLLPIWRLQRGKIKRSLLIGVGDRLHRHHHSPDHKLETMLGDGLASTIAQSALTATSGSIHPITVSSPTRLAIQSNARR